MLAMWEFRGLGEAISARVTSYPVLPDENGEWIHWTPLVYNLLYARLGWIPWAGWGPLSQGYITLLSFPRWKRRINWKLLVYNFLYARLGWVPWAGRHSECHGAAADFTELPVVAEPVLVVVFLQHLHAFDGPLGQVVFLYEIRRGSVELHLCDYCHCRRLVTVVHRADDRSWQHILGPGQIAWLVINTSTNSVTRN